MFPNLIEKQEGTHGAVHLLETGVLFQAMSMSLIDAEVEDVEARERALLDVLKNLKPNHTARFWLRSYGSNLMDGNDSRRLALSETCFVRNDLTLIVEQEAASSKELFKRLAGKKESRTLAARVLEFESSFNTRAFESAGFRITPLTDEQLNRLFLKPIASSPLKLRCGLDLGQSVIGCVRLKAQSATSIPLDLLSNLKDQLPLPYQIRVSVRKVPKNKSETLLRKRVSQNAGGAGLKEASVHQDSEEHLRSVTLEGSELFEVEFLVLFERDTEKELRATANEAVQILKPLGEFVFETVGALPSLIASEAGSSQHVALLESEEALMTLLPVLSRGQAASSDSNVASGSLTLHRRDQTLDSVDLFAKSYDNYSACIFGKSGRGKSVFTNLLTRALMNDPNIAITKVDVGGSHSKETKSLGGVEHKMSLTRPSGLKPFAALNVRSEQLDENCGVLATFIGVLLLEEGETFLPKATRGEIEEAVKDYALTHPEHPSIDGFYAHAMKLPRRALLKRWTSSGVFKNAFANGEAPDRARSRLVYMNFSEIFQAADPDFSQGVMAAVIAQFNLDLMRNRDRRFVFIVDEAPFFITRCFDFFKFSTANVRKFGGSFIIVAQTSAEVVVNQNTAILDNTSMKMLFSIDGERDVFQKRLKLDNNEMQRLESLTSKKGEYSEMLFKDAFGSRAIRVQLSKQEYWSVTSSQDDNKKIQTLMTAVPGLTTEEAIAVLSRIESGQAATC